LRLDAASGRLDVVAQVGFDSFPSSVAFQRDWVAAQASTFLDAGHPLIERWSELCLAQAILCPFSDQRTETFGIILGGLTREHQYYFDPIKPEVRTSFAVMVGQAGALLGNYELKRSIREKNLQLEDYSKNLEDTVAQRTAELRRANENLDVANQFIRKTFGRYLSEDVVQTILDAPGGARLSGVKRCITLLMADLRGFTAISERLVPEDVLQLINLYLGMMTDVILKYGGTIDEFLGDAIFALFGAPIEHEDAHERAVACAVEMQLAMAQVNDECRRRGLPELAQGIGLNTGEVIVGNMGCLRRSKYGVVGRAVNLTSRIESHTVGGQILISDATRQACGQQLRIDGCRQIMAKGIPQPVEIFDVGGIGGRYGVYLPERAGDAWIELNPAWSVRFALLEDKEIQQGEHAGTIPRIADNAAVLYADVPLEDCCNVRLSLLRDSGIVVTSSLFGKITSRLPPATTQPPWSYRLCFTHIPPEVRELLRGQGAGCCLDMAPESLAGARA
jgi:adenylate cyclase